MEKTITEKRVTIRLILFLSAWFLAVHMLAFLRDWYRIIPWVDIPLHISGGVIGALILYRVFGLFEGKIDLHRNFPTTFLIVISLAALAGVFWEFGEFFYDQTVDLFAFNVAHVQLGNNDTLMDLASDLIGAGAVAIFMRLRYRGRYNKS